MTALIGFHPHENGLVWAVVILALIDLVFGGLIIELARIFAAWLRRGD